MIRKSMNLYPVEAFICVAPLLLRVSCHFGRGGVPNDHLMLQARSQLSSHPAPQETLASEPVPNGPESQCSDFCAKTNVANPSNNWCWVVKEQEQCESSYLWLTGDGIAKPCSWQLGENGEPKCNTDKDGSDWVHCAREPNTYCHRQCSSELRLHLGNFTSDLGTQLGSMTFYDVFPGSNSVIDLAVTNISNYVAFNPSANGLLGAYGKINVKSGTSVDLKFKFIDRLTGQPWQARPFYMSFSDLDRSKTTEENITFTGIKTYALSSDTLIAVYLSGAEDRTTFSAGFFDDAIENPTDPLSLTPEQEQATVTVLYPAVHEFFVTISLGAGRRGRNMLFTGASSVACH